MTAPARPPPPPPPPPGIRGCHARGVPRSGVGVGARWGWGGTARWEASAAPCAADFDRLRRTAPAPEGALRLRRSRLVAAGHADHRAPPPPNHRAPGDRARGGGARPRVLFSGLSAGGVRVFVGAIGVERSLHRGGGGGPRRPAPSRAQEGGREHPRRGRRGPLRRPAVERARKLLSAARWTNFFFFCRVVGFPCLLPSQPRSVQQGRDAGVGEDLASRGWGTQCAPRAPPSSSARPPAPTRPPPPRSRSLRKLRP